MAGYSQLKASMCPVAVNIMLFNYILSYVTEEKVVDETELNLVPTAFILQRIKQQ